MKEGPVRKHIEKLINAHLSRLASLRIAALPRSREDREKAGRKSDDAPPPKAAD